MVRFQQRLFAFRRNSYTSTGVRVAVVGAGTNGAAALREMQQSPILGLVPVVAVDDDPGLWNRSMHGVPVTGSVDDLPRIVADHDVHLMLLAMPVGPAAGRAARRRHRRGGPHPGARRCGSPPPGCTACHACAR